MNTQGKCGEVRSLSVENRSGMTLVEVMISMCITFVMCAGIYTTGINVQGFSESLRVAVEARSLAKEKLEELIAYGVERMADPSSMLADETTHISVGNVSIRRTPRVIWHASNGSVTNAGGAAYAEVHVGVEYMSPQTRKMVRETFSTMVK